MSLMAGAALFLASVVTVPSPPGLPSTDVTTQRETIYQTDRAGTETQAFLEIDNAGPADQLTGVECPLADNTSLVGGDGKPVAKIAIPAHGALALAPSGPHLLLQNTHFSVQFGSIIPCSLVFANAGTVSIFLYATPAP